MTLNEILEHYFCPRVKDEETLLKKTKQQIIEWAR